MVILIKAINLIQGILNPVQSTPTITQSLQEEVPALSPIQLETTPLIEQPDVTINPLNQQPIQSSPSTILQPSATTSSLTQALQAEEPQQATLAEEPQQAVIEGVIPGILPKKDQVLLLYSRLKKQGKLTTSTKKPNPNAASGSSSKTIDELLDDIHTVPNYENWLPLDPPERRGRPQGTTFAKSASKDKS